jgi:hypothetical protein
VASARNNSSKVIHKECNVPILAATPIKVKGRMCAHPRWINWSNLSRASDALIHMRKSRNGTAIEIPKNSTKNKVEIVTIFVYSPRKKKAKLTALCSVKKPATYSDSPSGKSKGALLVSAIAEIMKRIAMGNSA